MNRTVSLNEALTGVAFYVTHLDGQQKYIELPASDIIKPNDILAVEGEGMPQNGSIFNRGNLYVKFLIEFPKSLSSDQKKSLMKILPSPARPITKPKDQVDIYTLQRIDPETTQRKSPSDDDDEMHGHGGSNVQCQQA